MTKALSLKILIEGERVQGVGYRIFILQKAMENGIEGIYARNVGADKVEVLVSDRESKVDRFYEALEKERPEDARVRSIRKEPYKDEIPVPTIDRYFHFLTVEQMSRGREEITGVAKRLDVIGGGVNETNKKLDVMNEKLDVIGGGVNETKKKLDDLPERIADAVVKGIMPEKKR